MKESEQLEINPPAVSVKVITTYLPSHSNPDESYYTFAYTITISNNGDIPVQLLSRHWIITDADEQVQEVRGEGVVGEQPIIAPGKYFRYTSGTTMETSVGFMEGSYTMIAIAGEEPAEFDVPIPPFSLHTPNALH
jgi:ApaG protein